VDQVGREQHGEEATNAGVLALEGKELAALVTRVVDGLPPRCREVFVLSRYRRLTQREVAATLGITVNTVNVQLGRALRALDEALRERE
jgi:RNA polymerase sigma-70 factor (ECF subfamily)